MAMMSFMFTMMKAMMNARMKLKNGPATIVEILPQTLAFRKDPSLSSPSFVISPSSPSNMHAPPMGNSFSEYFVPFL